MNGENYDMDTKTEILGTGNFPCFEDAQSYV